MSMSTHLTDRPNGAKPRVQQALRWLSLYERVRASYLCRACAVLVNRRRDLDFYRSLLSGLRRGDLIFDVGANDGTKTDVFMRLGARVVAVEPDELNVEIMRRRFLMLRLPRKPLNIVPAAVSDSVGKMAMWVDAPGSAQNTLSDKWASILRNDDGRFNEKFEFAKRREVTTTTLEQLMTEFGVPYFIKIDVEGFEPKVLKGLRRPVPFLSFEVNLPEFRPEGAECIDLLRDTTVSGLFNFASDFGRGLALERWLSASEFSAVFDRCSQPSIEVFWRAT